MLCNKCKQAPQFRSDTWCLACTAWEQAGLELSASWKSPGARQVATDLLVSAVRQIRAVRRLGQAAAVSGPAASSRSLSAGAPTLPVTVASSVKGSRDIGLKAAPKADGSRAIGAVKAEEDEEEGSEEESESESEEADNPVVPNRERSPVPRRRSREGHLDKKGVREREKSRERSRKKTERRSEKREHRSERKEKSKERSKKEKDGGEKKHKKTRRGGRKHQRYSRSDKQPYQRLHYRIPRENWDQAEGELDKNSLETLRLP